jgi:poly-gamma-glutamate capsule biosynthesis protein CapA/YwtB (metallophosphatase superfamily)
VDPLAATRHSADPGTLDEDQFDPLRPLARELGCSISDGFVLGAVGDCILSRPLTQLSARDPGFAATLTLLRGCDAVYGNLETVLVDPAAAHPHSAWRDWPLACDPAVAADLGAMGFALMSRANNHALDWGLEGMRASSAALDAAGLVHAGCGESQGAARAARYRETEHGRVALVSCATTFRETTDALPERGAARARPGISGLELTRVTRLPADLLANAEQLRDRLAQAGVASALGELGLAEEGPAFHDYAMDEQDLAGILRQVRQGKAYADLLVVAIHAHEAHAETRPQRAGGFLREFAHRAIEAGADVVAASGIHELGAVELHRGRPILHGLGNFFWSDIQEPLPDDLYRGNREALDSAFARPERATDADLTLLLTHPDYSRPETYESVLTQVVFEAGRASAVRVHPVDLGHGRRLTESGIPRVAGAAQGERILARVEELSAGYGTKIEIEHAGDRVVGTVKCARS